MFLKKNSVCWHIFKLFLFPFPCWSSEGIFLRYFLWETGDAPKGKCHNIVWGLYALWRFYLSGLSILRRHSQLLFRFSYPGLFPGKLWLPVSTSLSLQSCGSSLLCVLSDFMDPGRVLDFSVCSFIYLLLGQGGGFQAPRLKNQKPEVFFP